MLQIQRDKNWLCFSALKTSENEYSASPVFGTSRAHALLTVSVLNWP